MAELAEYEVVVVGGGPAGLGAGLLLGRCRRRTLVCDSGRYRNRAATAMHGYLTRDGINPREFLEIGRRELACYPDVEFWSGEITDIRREGAGFFVSRQRDEDVLCRKVVLATGVIDELPDLEGAAELMGRGVHHCPYCDGWEVRDQRLAVYGREDQRGAELALTLTRWSDDVVLLTDGGAELDAECRKRLVRVDVRVEQRAVLRLEAENGRLARVRFRDGSALECAALFFNTGRHQATDFAQRLGCAEFDIKGCIVESRSGQTSVPGLYIVGDASRDVLQVSVAAAEGCEAAIAINRELMKEEGVLV